MNNVPHQNVKVLEESLAGSNSDAVKKPLRGLLYFKMTFPFSQVLEKSLSITVSLNHIQWRELRMVE